MERNEYALMAAAEDDMWWYRALHARLLEKLEGVHGRVLDAGCGTGGFLAESVCNDPNFVRSAATELKRRCAGASRSPMHG